MSELLTACAVGSGVAACVTVGVIAVVVGAVAIVYLICMLR